MFVYIYIHINGGTGPLKFSGEQTQALSINHKHPFHECKNWMRLSTLSKNLVP